MRQRDIWDREIDRRERYMGQRDIWDREIDRTERYMGQEGGGGSLFGLTLD